MIFREIIKIPIRKTEIHVGAAIYIATIIYPESHKKRTDFVNACRAYLIKEYTNGRLPRRLVHKEEILAFDRKRRIYSQFNKAEYILVKKRIPALEILNLSLTKKAIPTFLKKDNEQYKFSILKYLSLHYPTPEKENGLKYNERSAMDRIWRPSKPILHLIGGLDNSIPSEKKPISIEYLLLNPEWVVEALKISDSLSKLLIMMQPVSIKKSEQIILISK